jgi:hypothetical protein
VDYPKAFLLVACSIMAISGVSYPVLADDVPAPPDAAPASVALADATPATTPANSAT